MDHATKQRWDHIIRSLLVSDKIPNAREPELESELIGIVNQHINERSIKPEPTAQTMLIMAVWMLDALAWKPADVRDARELILRAAARLEG